MAYANFIYDNFVIDNLTAHNCYLALFWLKQILRKSGVSETFGIMHCLAFHFLTLLFRSYTAQIFLDSLFDLFLRTHLTKCSGVANRTDAFEFTDLIYTFATISAW